MGLGQGHTLEEGTVPLKTAEIPGGTSSLQFEQDHQCLCRSCGGGGSIHRQVWGGLHDNLNHTRGVHALEASDEPPNDRSGVNRYWKYCLDVSSLKPNQAYLHSSPRDA